MRERVGGEALEQFMKAVGGAGRTNARIYFVGGATDQLYKYPAIDGRSFRQAVEDFVTESKGS